MADSTPNKAQQKAIETTEQPLLIIAGPGSGKTKTLVDRVLHLILDLKVQPENIMIATFTEKAAKELVTRISNKALEKDIIINISDMYIGTLHSIFLNLLDEYRAHTDLKRNLKTLDDFEQRYLIYRHARDFEEVENYNILFGDFIGWSTAKEIAKLVNKVSEENLDIKKLKKLSKSPNLQVLANITEKYRSILQEENAIDFSIIQTKMLKLLEDEYVLNEIRKKIQYLMIDEYQDTNQIQEQILLKIASPKNKICVVGDDDQALYRFRGATVENILRFQEKFPKNKCVKIELSNNYRSHPKIVELYNNWMKSPEVADKWIGENGENYRYPKKIVAAGKQSKENNSYNATLKLMGGTADEWYQNFYDFVKQAKKKKLITDYNQIAVLCYSVKSEKIAGLATFLESKGIPIFSPRSDLFFQREEIRLLIGAYVFIFPSLVDKYLRTPNTKEKNVWAYYEDCNNFFANTVRNDLTKHKSLVVYCNQKVKELNNLKENTNYTFSNIFYEFLQFPLFSQFIAKDMTQGVQDLRPSYNLALFSQLITRFESLYNVIVFKPENIIKDIKALFNYYLNFLYEGGIEEYEDFDMVTPSGCISFMTIHQSKGLQFPITCVASLDRTPKKSYSQIDEDINKFYYKQSPYEPLEEIKYFDFWRLYYTAFSRPQNVLILTGIDNSETRQKGEKASPTKYFDCIYKTLPEWNTLFDAKSLPKIDTVTEANLKHEYSFTSHILLYENCPRQYKFFRELEFTPVQTNAVLFGTLVHETIEDIHRHVLEGKVEAVTNENIYGWMMENYRQLSKMTGLYLQQGGLNKIMEHVNNYVSYASTDWTRIKEAEVPVTLQKNDYILEGKIDLIQGNDNTIEILDFKTEKKPDMETEEGREKLQRYRRQLELYAHIIENRYGKKISRMHLYYTGAEDESPFVSYDYNRAAIDHTIKDIDSVVKKIQKKDFEINPKIRCKKLCGQCDLNSYCNML